MLFFINHFLFYRRDYIQSDFFCVYSALSVWQFGHYLQSAAYLFNQMAGNMMLCELHLPDELYPIVRKSRIVHEAERWKW